MVTLRWGLAIVYEPASKEPFPNDDDPGHLQIPDTISHLRISLTMCLKFSNFVHLSLAISGYASTQLAQPDSLVSLPVLESVIRRDASGTEISSSSVSLTNTVSTSSPPTSLSITTITSTNLVSTGTLSAGTSAAAPTSTNNLGYAYWFPLNYSAMHWSHDYTPTEYDSLQYIENLYQIEGGWIKLYSIQPDEDFPQLTTPGITDLSNFPNQTDLSDCIQWCTNLNDGDDMRDGTYTGCSGVSVVQDTCLLKAGPMTNVSSTSSPGAISAVLHLVK